MKLIFATHNSHKVAEISKLLPVSFMCISLGDVSINEEIPETGSTLEENALIKARFVTGKTGLPCFADDSGLEVTALNGAPGVYSARYAGEQKNDTQNIHKLLRELNGAKNRKACFRTVIALCSDGKEYMFEGIIHGTIAMEMRGNNGFGYDPVFIPDGYERTFAEMSLEEKNKISHRAQAVKKLIDFLNPA